MLWCRQQALREVRLIVAVVGRCLPTPARQLHIHRRSMHCQGSLRTSHLNPVCTWKARPAEKAAKSHDGLGARPAATCQASPVHIGPSSPQGNLVKLQDFLKMQNKASRGLPKHRGPPASDMHKACTAFLGWTVINQQQPIGKVAQLEIVRPGEEVGQEDEDLGGTQPASQTADDVVSVLLCVHKPTSVEHQVGVWRGTEVHRIPVAPALIPWVDPTSRALIASLPKGFLDLGRDNVLIDFLSEALRPYAQPAPGGQAITPVAMSQGRLTPPGTYEDDGYETDDAGLMMPSSAVLEAANRRDLLGLVRKAGGHAAVAAALGWTCPRRPRGYWDDPANLDVELDAFIATAWLELPNELGPGTYFYNQISGEVSSKSPWGASASSSKQAAGGGRPGSQAQPIMPTMTQILDAGRLDLKYAINKFGGVAATAELLGRQLASSRRCDEYAIHDDAELLAELQGLCAELQLPPGVMPTHSQLQAAGRQDLVHVIRQRGGWNAAARQLQLRTRRRLGQETSELDSAACLLMEFMISEIQKTCDMLREASDAMAVATSTARTRHGASHTGRQATADSSGTSTVGKTRQSQVEDRLAKLKHRNQTEPAPGTAPPAAHSSSNSQAATGQSAGRSLNELQASLATAFKQLAQAKADNKSAAAALAAQQALTAVPVTLEVAVPRWLASDAPRLPSIYALVAARQFDLSQAVQKHGRKQLEEQCGLTQLRGGQTVAYQRLSRTSVSPAEVQAAIAARLLPGSDPGATQPVGLQQGQDQQEGSHAGVSSGGTVLGVQGGALSSFTRAQMYHELNEQGLAVTRTQVQIAVDKLLSQGLVVQDRARKWLLHVVGAHQLEVPASDEDAVVECLVCKAQGCRKPQLVVKRKMRAHIARHILSGNLPSNVCGFCGGSQCVPKLLTSKTGRLKLCPTSCKHAFSGVSYGAFLAGDEEAGSEIKARKWVRCTNIPLPCPVCGQVVWRYGLAQHCQQAHKGTALPPAAIISHQERTQYTRKASKLICVPDVS